MGDPGARLLTSPLPQPTLPTSCFSSFPPPHPSPSPPPPPPNSKKKKSDHARHWQLLGSSPLPHPYRLPRVRAASRLPPALILTPDYSHHLAGGLTAEATGPPLPSASQRESSPAPLRLGEAGPPRSAASGDHAGFRESSCAAAAWRSGATQGTLSGETCEAA